MVQCYYIIDSSFTGPSHFQQQHQNLGRFPQPSQAYVAQMGAMLATPEIVYDSNWNPDSGATNHVTADVANLMSKADFFGPDKVHMGNGKGLAIKHIGQLVSVSPYEASKCVSLKQLLHVHEITKNLFSVYKFPCDNHVFFKFHAISFFVKDQLSKAFLLEGKLKDGLYVFDTSQISLNKQWQPLSSTPSSSLSNFPSSALTCTSSASTDFSTLYKLWHNRLGHPYEKIVKNVLSSCNISHINKGNTFCYACCLAATYTF